MHGSPTRTHAALAGALVLGLTSLLAAQPPGSDHRVARDHGWIYDDFKTGLREAEESGKPLMVVLRCPP